MLILRKFIILEIKNPGYETIHPGLRRKVNNDFLDRKKSTGARDHQKASEATEEWCDENNCTLLTKKFEDPIGERKNTSLLFYAKVNTDD